MTGMALVIIGVGMVIGLVAHDGVCWSGCSPNNVSDWWGFIGVLMAMAGFFCCVAQDIIAHRRS